MGASRRLNHPLPTTDVNRSQNHAYAICRRQKLREAPPEAPLRERGVNGERMLWPSKMADIPRGRVTARYRGMVTPPDHRAALAVQHQYNA